MRVGICGYATAGKDVVADTLVDEFGFVKVNMSEALHRYMMTLNPIIGTDSVHGQARYRDIVHEFGYVGAKRHEEVRRLLQVFGTEVGRSIDPNLWVKERDKIAGQYENVVTTGIRFANEAVGLTHLVHVDRPGVGPVNDHQSDRIDEVIGLATITLVNDGTVDDLHRKTVEAFAPLLVPTTNKLADFSVTVTDGADEWPVTVRALDEGAAMQYALRTTHNAVAAIAAVTATPKGLPS